jgi:hypothetical protein
MLTNKRLQRWAAYLVFTGLVMSFVATMITNEAIRAVAAKGLLYTEMVDKPRIYYPFHAGQLVAMCGAGILALVALRKDVLKVGIYQFAVLLVVGLYIALQGYGFSDLLSTRIINPRGPMQCWISIVAFAGVFYGNWRIINRGLYLVAILLVLYCGYLMLTLGTVNRTIAMNNLTTPLNPLYWVGIYICFTLDGSWVVNTLKWVPLGVYTVGAIVTQTRLDLLMVLFGFVAYLFLRAKDSHDITKPIATVLLVSICVGGLLLALDGTSLQSILDYYSSALANRLTQDSRSGQLLAFFADVPIQSLIWGRGAEATWNWDGQLWKGGTDVGYLSVLFFGGVPMLVGLYLFLIRPALCNLLEGAVRTDLIAPVIVVLFAIRMFSSEFPSLDIEYYPILLAAGRCWGYLLAADIQRNDPSRIPERASLAYNSAHWSGWKAARSGGA